MRFSNLIICVHAQEKDLREECQKSSLEFMQRHGALPPSFEADKLANMISKLLEYMETSDWVAEVTAMYRVGVFEGLLLESDQQRSFSESALGRALLESRRRLIAGKSIAVVDLTSSSLSSTTTAAAACLPFLDMARQRETHRHSYFLSLC